MKFRHIFRLGMTQVEDIQTSMTTYRHPTGYIILAIFMQALAWAALIFAGAYEEGTFQVRFVGEAAMRIVRQFQFPLITLTSMDGFLLKYFTGVILYTIVLVTGAHCVMMLFGTRIPSDIPGRADKAQ